MRFRSAFFNNRLVRSLAAAVALGAALMSAPAHANFVNGNFESGSTSWTVEGFRNNGVSVLPPANFANLGLASAPGNEMFTLATGQHSVAGFPDANPALLPIPYAGTASGHVNGNSTTGGNRVTGARATAISQTITTTAADVDASDGLIHVRMTIAPVFTDPGHPDVQQPYFYIEVVNVTRSTTVYSMFNFANQPGVAWQTLGNIKYTGWQTIDVPVTGAAIGDQVMVRIVASGCSPTGHGGDIYVDEISTSVSAGLAITATGPATSLPGNNITYTYTYNNNGTTATSNNVVTVVSPQVRQQGSATVLNLPFTSLNVPPGVTCTPPAAGSPGTVSCNVGALAAGANGSFQITWTIPANASTTSPTNVVGHGNYNIAATGVTPVTGPLVNTTLLPLTTAVTDLEVTVDDGVTSVSPGGNTTYTIVVTNHGPTAVTGAPLTQTSTGVTPGAWTCVGSGGTAACSAASGSGALSGVTVTLGVGESVTITQAAVAGASGTTNTRVSVASPAAVPDSNTANNTDQDINTIAAAPAASLTPVPTLGTWALLGLVAVVSLLGASRRRRG